MLTDQALKALKGAERPYKKPDERGLFAFVQPNGAVYFRFKYRYGGREKLLAFGVYRSAMPEGKDPTGAPVYRLRPGDVTLKRAREKRDEARGLLERGIDPGAKRKAEKTAQADTFDAIALEWLAKGCPPRKKGETIGADTVAQLEHRLKTYVSPYIGKWPLAEIKASDLLQLLRRIESKGTHETAHRVRSVVGRVMRYAVNSGRAERDISADLKDALIPVNANHFSAITDPKALGALLRKMAVYSGQPATKAALQLLALTFVRPGELRLATWGEFDLDAAQWVIPAARMKMRKVHVVPLAPQAVEILTELAKLTDKGPSSWVFPSLRPQRPLSDGTLNMALRSMDVSGEVHVGHGFRSTASTLLHELGFSPDLIETQLAHSRPGVSGIYNRSHRLPEREKLMHSWANHLDGLRRGANVTAIRSGKSA
ncbi:MAG: tyrosine-type recombinase/integrase [Gammaproteobacteria bacterium]